MCEPDEPDEPAGRVAHTAAFLDTGILLRFGMQVVEISSLTEHLLTECDRRDGFGKCYRCSEAVLKEELPRHIKTKECNRECGSGGASVSVVPCRGGGGTPLQRGRPVRCLLLLVPLSRRN